MENTRGVCGFSGELAADGPADPAATARMAQRLAPRGPDGHGTWAGGRLALSHRRLKIIDLSERAAQPMVDPQLGLVVVFNGCVYNYRELRAELEAAGYAFFSRSDTEVVAKAYAHWGADCVQRFRGMFAFAVAEIDSGRLVLVRDRLGIKPLYVADLPGGRLRFASTLPALLAGGEIDDALDPVALHHFFSWHAVVPAPRTVLRGVRKLAPASVLVIEPDGRRVQRTYWEPHHERPAERAPMAPQEWTDAVLDGLRAAVERRMVADVPVGVLLSGGLDSSIIVALLAEAGQHGLKTFSIGFASSADRAGDEFAYSDAVAQRYATEHTRWSIPTPDIAAALPDAIAAMSEPMVSHDAVAFYLLSREVSRACKVVQCGQGADEIFAGYSWYPPLRQASGLGDDTYAREFFDRPHDEMGELLESAHRCDEDVSRAFVAAHFARSGAQTALDRALRLDTQVMLVDDPVKRVDNMTMAWGLEARTPFLDHELVELVASCPPELKLADGGKGVLKAAGRTLLAADVVDREKGYFPVPALSDLTGEPLELVRDALRSRVARERGLMRPEYVEKLLADPQGHHTTIGGNKLWQIGLLELWLQAHGVGTA
jgi:asparagine synthase (glutamine-hydrolysing)